MTSFSAPLIILQAAEAIGAGGGVVRPAIRLDGDYVLEGASAHSSLVPDSVTTINLQEGGDAGYAADRPHIELTVGVSNVAEPLAWSSEHKEVHGLWWVYAEVDLGAAGYGALEVALRNRLDLRPVTREERLNIPHRRRGSLWGDVLRRWVHTL